MIFMSFEREYATSSWWSVANWSYLAPFSYSTDGRQSCHGRILQHSCSASKSIGLVYRRRTSSGKSDDPCGFAAGICRRDTAQPEVINGTSWHSLPRVLFLVGRMRVAEWYPLPDGLVLDDVLVDSDWGVGRRLPGDVKTVIGLPHAYIAWRIWTWTCSHWNSGVARNFNCGASSPFPLCPFLFCLCPSCCAPFYSFPLKTACLPLFAFPPFP